MRRIVIPATAVLLFAFGPAISSGQVIYMDDDAKMDFRTIQTGINIADDSAAEASKNRVAEPVCDAVIAGDINGDCRVDFADLALLAANWLCTEQSLFERYSELLKIEVLNASKLIAGYRLLSYSRDEGPGPVFRAPQELCTAQAVPFLIHVLENGPDWTEERLLTADAGMIPHIARCYAALCLGVSGDPRAFGPLVQQLKAGTFLEEKYTITSNHKDDYHISRYAALALGYLGDRRAVEPLIQTLREKAYFECVYALGRLADLRGIWAILDYLSEDPGSGSVAHETLTYLTMAQFTIEYSREDKQFMVMEFPELGKMEAGDVYRTLWLHWRTAGQEYADRQFDQYYQERKNLVESYPDLPDLGSVCGVLERKMIRGGIAVLPTLMAKVAQGDTWLIPYAAQLVRRGRTSGPAMDTPLLLKPDATQAECLQWWEDNKAEWLIFSPSE
jgi:hypothetical protein